MTSFMEMANHGQNQNKPCVQSQSWPCVKFANRGKPEVVEVVDLSDESNLIIMGDSPLDAEIAAKLDAIQLPNIVSDNSLDELRAAL